MMDNESTATVTPRQTMADLALAEERAAFALAIVEVAELRLGELATEPVSRVNALERIAIETLRDLAIEGRSVAKAELVCGREILRTASIAAGGLQ